MQWKTKPDGLGWTDSQWEAISGSGRNLLVSAAAGSGKTAVLVERIIHKITTDNPPVDVDKLLIVTFTKAAAAEMKSRISAALIREINKNPSSLHLQRQLSLVNRAHISTLHSFCMAVIRKYYYKINIDPQFRILDETEGELMREEILDEVFEERYSTENDKAFLDAAERFSGDRSDEGLRNVVRKLFHFSRTHPEPSSWLQKATRSYQIDDQQSMDDLVWGEEIWKDAKIRLTAALDMLQKAKTICLESGGPLAYLENFEEDEKQLKNLADANRWEELYQSFQHLTFGRLKTIKKNEEIDETLQAKAKKLRETIKKDVTNLKSEAFDHSPQELLQDIREMAFPMETLIQTVEMFSQKYKAAKEEKGVVDFSDLEQLCLTILNEEGSEAAEDFQQRFAEIMVDEYQDTNHAQEAILQTISNGNNLFLVGDVKQSVYRFRLADPGLFLDKYKQYNREQGIPGWKINLDQNFRSRHEIIDATNFIFKQLMDERTGEVMYDESAELKTGNTDYPETINDSELVIVNKGEPLEPTDSSTEEAEEDMETAQLEARWIARKIKQLIDEKYQVLDKETKQMRQMTFRDVVILMRSMPWASTFMEECKKEGLPVYAELSGGYFEAVEINVMLSLLKVIDNPRQDIPLASVLRSPIVGMDEEELANIRMMERHGLFFDALKETVHHGPASTWQEKAVHFYEQLRVWRQRAHSEALSEFIWDLLQETGYYDFAGGLPGGKQRQANLLALYDRARTYEKTSFRGLFRFLRFIERMQEKGDDLGTARALGEQEDVIRLMTIHKSKGLEFPVVFLAGMNKQFNFQDLNNKVLLHKQLGIGSKYIDPEQRTVKSSIPQLALKKRNHRESIAEEMRVLYVAMTRAKEKLYMVATLRKPEKTIESWLDFTDHGDWLLPELDRLKAKSFLDWVGPAIFRHQTAAPWHHFDYIGYESVYNYPSQWQIHFVERHELADNETEDEGSTEEMEQLLLNQDTIETKETKTGMYEQLNAKLTWEYPYKKAVTKPSKQTVSQFKRTLQDEYSEPSFQTSFHSQYAERPLFMQQSGSRPAEKGTALHTFMEHMPLQQETISTQHCTAFLSRLVERELLTEEQASMIDIEGIAAFFQSELGERMKQAEQVNREIPFSYGKQDNAEDDMILIQGAVDCVFKEADGNLVLLDYKTDAFESRFPANIDQAVSMMKDRYQSQIDLYREALSSIWGKDIKEAYIYAFDGAHVIDMMN
ncbi:helicase-exonuclease AddAB subunit AddA [Salibacterium salarium]|uniref:ATP-dependent helicase/nuclease subunit A n=1 Tax=Salibacterium salarium TaxID=284579 RepID=A0A3R9QLE3_9BACI|nr:helicase-exonuclease AddAB subunit AddA [Salibacterium salarium]RSL33382.1 helicase-exonuclease AddAB subunit AddA [Salibacterium salarium]